MTILFEEPECVLEYLEPWLETAPVHLINNENAAHRRASLNAVVHPSSTVLLLVQRDGRGLTANDIASLQYGHFELVGMIC